MTEIKLRDLSKEIKDLKTRSPKGSSPFDQVTRLGGKFTLLYPFLVGLLLLIAYRCTQGA